MRSVLWVAVLVLGVIGEIDARGTLAGTSVANQALIVYAVGGIDHNLTSTTDTFVVDRIVDLQVVSEDSAPVKVAGGDFDRVLTFRVTNEGNSEENLTLIYDHNTTSDFVPQNVRIFQDTNGNGLYDPGTDVQVTALPNLGADTNATLFLVGDIPDDNTTAPTHRSFEILRAVSESNATSGADRPGTVDVVIRTGSDADTGIWEIRDYWFTAKKNATVHSDDNATHTGTRITYTITYYIDGNAAGKTIQHVVLTDAIPSNTRYVPGSLRQDGAPRTDAVDGDNADCNGTVVHLNAGTISGATRHRLGFEVEVE